MEGTNRPFLKAPAPGTLSGPPHCPGRPRESSRGGRVENRDQEKEGLGRMEGVPAATKVREVSLRWDTLSPGWPSPPHGPGKRPGALHPSQGPSSRGPLPSPPPNPPFPLAGALGGGGGTAAPEAARPLPLLPLRPG